MITSCLSSHALTIEVLLTTICSVSYCRVYLALSSSSLVPKNYEYHTKQFRTFRIFQIRSQCSGHVTRSPNQITTRHEAHYFWYISCLHTFNLLCPLSVVFIAGWQDIITASQYHINYIKLFTGCANIVPFSLKNI